MNRIEDQEFENETVVLDFQHFHRCRFTNCALVYHGAGPVGLDTCHFEGCNWNFADAAANTLQFMQGMYRHGGGAEEIIESTFAQIRGDRNP